ncbi:hypothetical protein [Paracidovorax konjaci]|uniref:Uncharacterized protein n=1 Tax=Paracidovorax konjaci TaxID=32040 RepID=A0A1I1YJF9_9BURK|nr:hypothetical protein [Paracidovorax konjaci]SFE19677.1 hypothetical protein SAMN04489710_11848 [Paracidovorax konjaci]
MTEAISFTKEDTVALWHAVEWMAEVVRVTRDDGSKDEQARAQYEVELGRLIAAKRALRKANAIRKSQAQAAKLRNSANCSSAEGLQADRKSAGRAETRRTGKNLQADQQTARGAGG